MFLGLGLLLLFGAGTAERLLLHSSHLAAAFFPNDVRAQVRFLGVFGLATIVAAGLCLITAWGMKDGRRWSRWTGICASTLLLPLFPWVSLAGIAGLWVLIAKWPGMEAGKKPAKPAVQSKDYWNVSRKSFPQQFVAGLLGAVGFFALRFVAAYAHKLGMNAWQPGMICLPVLLLVDVTVHEMGHVTVAWALYQKLRAINIGPFTLRNFAHGRQFHFDWKRLFSSTGFVSSASLTGGNLRSKLIAEVAGGPAAALLGALVMAAAFLSLPGTRWQAVWWIPGYLSVIFLWDGIANLIPLGYCDGSMLFHLILGTPAGRALINLSALGQVREEAESLRGQADFGKAAELWSAALDRARACGERNAFAIAFCHERLGYARHLSGDWPAAEADFRKCLGFEAECAAHTPLLVNCRSLLHEIAFERHHGAEAGRAYTCALAALEQRRKDRDRGRVGRSISGVMISRAHFHAGAFQKALEEAQAVLRILLSGRERILLRAEACTLLARAQFALGAGTLARISAAEAAESLRSPDIPPGRRNLAWNDLARFGDSLWRLGETEMAAGLMADAIAHLEDGGAVPTAARYRIKLASVHRQLGHLDEAWKCLPQAGGLPDFCHRSLLAERARLYLAAARPEDAIADCQRLLPLWRSDPVETALVESLLAEALLDAGDAAQGVVLARRAADVLGPWQHCEAANCLLTLALAQWHAEGEWSPEYVDKAWQLIELDSLLHRAGKRRLLAAQSARLKRHRPLDTPAIPKQSITMV
jgi:tetratricopeptide (TPR) repeat protein